jgi:hypothetical protein
MRHLLRVLNRLVCGAVLVAGCYSDVAPPPDVRVEDPGAFVATYSDGQYGLFRSLGTLDYFDETFVVMLVYDVHPSSWEDAGEMAKHADLRLPNHANYGAEAHLPPNRPVWFRTLTYEEGAVR